MFAEINSAFASWNEVADTERQATHWKDEEEMQTAVNFQYPVLLKPNESMPEITLNMNGYIVLSRKTRQSVEEPILEPPPMPRKLQPCIHCLDSYPSYPLTNVALQNYLLFANRQFLAKINRDGTGVQALRLTHSSGQAINAIATDYDIRWG